MFLCFPGLLPRFSMIFHVFCPDFPRFPGHRGGEAPAPRAAQGPEHRREVPGGHGAGRGRGGGSEALGGGTARSGRARGISPSNYLQCEAP